MTVLSRRAVQPMEKAIIGQFTLHVLKTLKEVIIDEGKHNVKSDVIWAYKLMRKILHLLLHLQYHHQLGLCYLLVGLL